MAGPNPNTNVAGPSSGTPAGPSSDAPRKKKGHRGSKNRKKRDRRKSFAITNEEINHDEAMSTSIAATSQSFYGQRHNLSGTSIDSETLLDHRYGLLLAPLFKLSYLDELTFELTEISHISCALDDLQTPFSLQPFIKHYRVPPS